MKKKDLEILLSRLKSFEKQRLDLEQYQTEAGIAADLLWYAYMQGDVEGKVVADLGCGNGVFGVGALILGAEKVYFLDLDATAIKIAKENVAKIESIFNVKFKKSFSNSNVNSFNKKVDLVIQNPPFGVKKTHADKPFLIKAMKCAKKIYTFHKMETRKFVENFVNDEGWKIKFVKMYKFPLRRGKTNKGYSFWKKDVHYVDVGVWMIYNGK